VAYRLPMDKVVTVFEREVLRNDAGGQKEILRRYKKNLPKEIVALGNGALPDTVGMKKIRAKRAAEVMAFAEMAEKAAGVQIDGETTVRDLMVENDKIQSSVSATLKGLKPTRINYPADDECRVTLQLKVRRVIETVHTITRHTQTADGVRKETKQKVKEDVIDEVLTATGIGAARSTSADYHPGQSPVSKREEQRIWKRVKSERVVIE